MLRTALLFVVSGLASQAGEAPVSYAFDVRPILSDKCFSCHGPDAAKRESGLRLDTADGAYAPFKEGKGSAIVPGDLSKSAAWRRILSNDPEQVMPPPKSHLSLAAGEKEILKKWIEQGAKYEPHWAFQPLPETIPVPETRGATWPLEDMDRFVLKKLETQNLPPSPAAGPARWLRRVTFDLTGLPPSAEEIEAFTKDSTIDFPQAKSAAVDRLLASKSFGEHFAVAWLDAARYADSYGYQSDQLTAFWPWRDWVIRSLNRNLPIDQFMTWQIAGDLLPDATEDQKLATTFSRLHRLTNEGGSIQQEFLTANMNDRVQTFGSVFLALTLECTRCHDHKYDPVTMRDYYSIGAFFNSIPERGFYSSATIQPAPALLLPSDAQRQKMAEAKQRIAAAEQAVADRRAASEEDFARWLTTPDRTLPVADLVSSISFNGDGNLGAVPDTAGAPDAQGNNLPRVPGKSGSAVRFDGDTGVSLPGRLEFDRCDPWTIDISLRDTLREKDPVIVLHRSFGTDVGYNGIELLLADGYVEARIVRDWPGNALAVRSVETIPQNEWSRITWTYDGSSNAAGLKLYLDGNPLAVEVVADSIWKSITEASYGDGVATLGQRFRDRGFRGGEIEKVQIYKRPLSPLEVASLEDPSRWQAALSDPSQRDLVKDTWLAALDPAYRQSAKDLRDAGAASVAAEQNVFEIPVMQEAKAPRPSYILARGAFDAPRTEETKVTRNTFTQILLPFPQEAPRDRLGLAKWLTDPRHPLTARVYVNRVWMNFFGAGIVESADNFGLQGSLPSHPELLDWLARDFISHGWDLKRLCRMIALSATYGQDSRMREDLLRLDPANRLLARGPSRRLSAEQIRDLTLSSSGLLKSRDGGPPVSPYQPGDDLWRESNTMSPAYQQSKGDDLYRRSVYSVWKRTSPLPNMLAFDSPTRELCTIRRSVTNTPLQALVMLDDVQIVEAARAMAAKVLPLPPEQRIASAFEACASRPPTPKESALLGDLFNEQLDEFRKTPDEARKFLAMGSNPAGRDFDPPETAAMTIVCQTILNLDASVWNR
jgi:hypothetical protein